MQTQAPLALDLEKLFEPLERNVADGTIEIEQFRLYHKQLQVASQKLQDLLEFVSDDKKGNKEWQRFYATVKGENISHLMDRLRGLGYFYGKDKTFRNIFEKQGYRLLEQTRAGKRDVVYFGLLRIFVSLLKEFPQILMEPFKPVYSDNIFKVLMFSFLSGVLGKEEIEAS